MTSIHEFFSPSFQKKLKQETFKLEKCEERLVKYKNLLLEGIKTLDLETRNPYHSIVCYDVKNNDVIKYTEEYIKILKSSLNKIDSFCDSLINSYKLFIKENSYSATGEFGKIIDKYNLITKLSTDNSIYNERLFFRARINDSKFDINNPIECFHIPFNKRYLISNQRFSVAGQPMWYLGNSIIDVCRELDKENIDNLVIYGFLPTYKVIKSLILLDSVIFNKFVKNIIPASNQDPNIGQVEDDIRKTILYEFLVFPRRPKYIGSFSEEYILPQAYTTYVLNKKQWSGIIYPSSKNYADIKNVHPYSRYNYNCAVFTKYSDDEIYDKELFYQTYHDFSVLYLDKNEKEITLIYAKNKFEELKKHQEKLKSSCLSYITPSHLELFDYLKDATINGENFFDTQYGKAELKIFVKLCDTILKAMRYQYENGNAAPLPIRRYLNLIN